MLPFDRENRMPLLGPYDASRFDKKLRASICPADASAEALNDIYREPRSHRTPSIETAGPTRAGLAATPPAVQPISKWSARSEARTTTLTFGEQRATSRCSHTTRASSAIPVRLNITVTQSAQLRCAGTCLVTSLVNYSVRARARFNPLPHRAIRLQNGHHARVLAPR